MTTKCFACGHEGYCEKHHIIPRRANGTNDSLNLVDLCPDCHKFVTFAFRGNDNGPIVYIMRNMTEENMPKWLKLVGLIQVHFFSDIKASGLWDAWLEEESEVSERS